ncbi:hypothetical protein Tco_1395497 [Tanacetum coccineum]
MEALIEYENAIDKGVVDTIKDHKRKHDDDDDDDEDPLAGPNQGKMTKRKITKEFVSSKRSSATKETPKGKAPSKGSKTGKSASAKEPVEEPIIEVVMDDAGKDLVRDEDQPQDASQPKKDNTLEWFKQPPRPPTLKPEWNKRQVVLDQPEQPWFNQMVYALKDPLTFDDIMATPIDFSMFMLNGLKIDNLTQDILLGHAYKLLKEHQGRQMIAAEYFFNNDLEFLKSSDPRQTYSTSITKTKVARYEIFGIEDMVPIGVLTDLEKLHGYGYLNKIVVKRADRRLYKFKEGDFVNLHLNDIEVMLLLSVQHKLFHLNKSNIVDLIVALRMFTRSLIIKRRVEDLQLGVESYQKKLIITAP